MLTLDTVQRGLGLWPCVSDDVRVRMMKDGCAFVFTYVLHSYGPKIEKEKKKKVDMVLTSGKLPQKLGRYLSCLHFAADECLQSIHEVSLVESQSLRPSFSGFVLQSSGENTWPFIL